jgi:NarL family two-component system response regulator LiaR
MNELIRVLIVDDHVYVRKGIQALLATEEDIVVVGEAFDGEEAIAQYESLKPDVMLLDLLMPKMGGIEAIHKIHSENSRPHILVLTSFAADDQVFAAIKAGALGYLLKDSKPEDLIRAIRQVNRGESSLSPLIARKLLAEISRPQRAETIPDPLTDREVEIIRLIAEGKSNRDIADELVISEATVRTHVSNILSKLHLSSRTQAAIYALRKGLATLDDAEGSES